MPSPDPPKLSHIDPTGAARMVDVSPKPATERLAVATAEVVASPAVVAAVMAGDLPKGEALAVARVAGIQAAKRTAELIPLCHPLALDWVEVEFAAAGDDRVVVTASAKTTARTGVEMEALTAATVAALTIYDMAKSIDKSMRIGPIALLRKAGGASGDYRRSDNG